MILRAKPSSPVFVCLTGDYPNIGDALIRRRSLVWARPGAAPINAFVGRAPDIWCKQIGIQGNDTVFRQADLFSWLIRLAIAPRGSVLVLEPGEVDLRKNQYKWEMLVLIFTLLIWLRGGTVVRPPRAVRDPSRFLAKVHEIGVRVSKFSYWRDKESLRLIGHGQVAPDIGFSEPKYGNEMGDRPYFTVSLRGLRETPSEEWFQAVQSIATSHHLSIVIVSQVRQDEARSKELGERLGAVVHNFEDRDDLTHETFLRTIYSRSLVVLSDRLHVLILAALGGAVPCEMVPQPSNKIQRHFATIEAEGISFNSSTASEADLIAFLEGILQRSHEIESKVIAAGRNLDAIETEIKANTGIGLGFSVRR